MKHTEQNQLKKKRNHEELRHLRQNNKERPVSHTCKKINGKTTPKVVKRRSINVFNDINGDDDIAQELSDQL